MFLFLSKLIPLLFYPVGGSIAVILISLILLKRRRRRLASALLILAMWLLYFSSTEFVAHGLTRSLESQNLPQTIPVADAIVVLGGATKTPQSPRTMPEVNEAGDRVIYAAKLYKDGKAPKIILSGGRVTWNGETGSESSDMASLLDLFSIPRSAIIEDPASLNTRQNAENVKVIVAREKLKRLILVTSATHMPRSLAIFRRLGMDVTPAPTDFYTVQVDQRKNAQGRLLSLLPDVEHLALTTRSLKEYVGLFVYRLRGWV
ncbi:YdcF family protein [filamentous cyanobacterium LEGE 11480]|uniref:YdcF family protein n=1 Tax=Romeriopsis navalis LEGE 11480 TaxID=2777977 RepID=A0A928VLY8_9CYAN|nr:YdcF family protein [Romeriopsis navalis]MBE9030072.1 YdcF family protein [Romeriopsis navalis LEGE 11480]